MSNHTKGPWRLEGVLICAPNGRALIDTDYIGGESEEECEANARLIAAAPDVLAALLFYKNDCSGHEPSISAFHRMVDAAIAKASGSEE